MLYYPAILKRQTGCFSTIWLVARNGKKVSKREILKVNVPKTCNDLMEYILVRVPPPRPDLPQPRLFLYLSSLLQYGVIKVYHQQCNIQLKDIRDVVQRIEKFKVKQKIDMGIPGGAMSLPDALCLMENSEWADDPLFGQMIEADLASISPSALARMGGQFHAWSPQTSFHGSQDSITARPEDITMKEATSAVMPLPEFEGADFGEVDNDIVDFLIDLPDDAFGTAGATSEREGAAGGVDNDITDPSIERGRGEGDMTGSPRTAATPAVLPLAASPRASPPHHELPADVPTPPPHRGVKRKRRQPRLVVDRVTSISQEEFSEQISNVIAHTADPPMAGGVRDDPARLLTRPCNKVENSNNKDMSTADVYLRACELVGVVPVSYFIRNLGNSTMNLNQHGLGPLGCKALAIALVTDMHINKLELVGNHILGEGAKYLVEMLKANLTIQSLDLSNNHLQTGGAECIGRMLLENISIKSVKLSGNGFTEDDAKFISDALASNYRVKELDLSHNKFCGGGGEHLGQMLANNEGLEVLDLSWNHLRMKGAVAFCAGLKANVTLKHLNLSWNGFGNEGALSLGEALKFNNTLVHLDLNNNRITNEGVGMLCRGLECNDTLRVLLLAYNSITVEGALALVNVVKNTPKSALEEINISNVLVNENFVQLLELTCQEHPSLEVQYGGVGGFIAKKAPKRPDPMKVIQDYLDKRKLRLWDFFRNIDKDGTMQVPVADFRKAVEQSSIPLDRFQIERLIQRLDRDGTGMVDYRGLADTRKQMMRDHRRQLRKAESREKKEKQKSDRILKTFQSAVEAVTPRGSLVMSPGGGANKEDSGGPQHFSATPLSSWHHIVMTNSSGRYSVTNLSGEHVHLPMLGGGGGGAAGGHHHHHRPLSSRSYMLDDSDAELDAGKLSRTANHLTRSRPALSKAKGKKKKKKGKKRADKISQNPTET